MSSQRNIVIFGLDNTLRDAAPRFNLIPRGTAQRTPHAWFEFHAKGITDEPNKAVIELFKMYVHNPAYDVYIWANTMEIFRDDVRKWLNKQGICSNSYQQLFLRPDANLLSNRETYERWFSTMPEAEKHRVKLVVSSDDDMVDVFAEWQVDTLKLNGVAAY